VKLTSKHQLFGREFVRNPINEELKVYRELTFFKNQYLPFISTVEVAIDNIRKAVVEPSAKKLFQRVIEESVFKGDIFSIMHTTFNVIGSLYFKKKFLDKVLGFVLTSVGKLFKEGVSEFIKSFLLEPNIVANWGTLKKKKLGGNLSIDTTKDSWEFRVDNKKVNLDYFQQEMFDQFTDYVTNLWRDDDDEVKVIFDVPGRLSIMDLFNTIQSVASLNADMSEGENLFEKAGDIHLDLQKPIRFFMRSYHRSNVSKDIFKDLIFLYNVLVYAQSTVDPRQKNSVEAQFEILGNRITALIQAINEQDTFLAQGRDNLTDIMAFYDTKLLELEKLKQRRFNHMERDMKEKKEFENWLRGSDSALMRKLKEFERSGQDLRFEYLLTLSYNLYKAKKANDFLTKKTSLKIEDVTLKEKAWNKVILETLFLNYDRFVNTYFREDIKNKLYQLYFSQIRNLSDDVVWGPDLQGKGYISKLNIINVKDYFDVVLSI
jgi:hypothetical protein